MPSSKRDGRCYFLILLEEAVREAIQVRFRPVALTTLTAVLGMLPGP